MIRSTALVVTTLALMLNAPRVVLGQSITDGTTPPSIAPGSPAGAYALSGFDTVSLYSGKVNLLVPLRTIAGRGAAGYEMTLPIQRNWQVREVANEDGTTSYAATTGIQP